MSAHYTKGRSDLQLWVKTGNEVLKNIGVTANISARRGRAREMMPDGSA